MDGSCCSFCCIYLLGIDLIWYRGLILGLSNQVKPRAEGDLLMVKVHSIYNRGHCTEASIGKINILFEEMSG